MTAATDWTLPIFLGFDLPVMLFPPKKHDLLSWRMLDSKGFMHRFVCPVRFRRILFHIRPLRVIRMDIARKERSYGTCR